MRQHISHMKERTKQLSEVNARGAVDLGSLAQAAQAQAQGQPAGAGQPAAGSPLAGGAAAVEQAPGQAGPGQGVLGQGGPGQGADGGVVIDATDADLPTLLERSRTVPVMLDLWATWCQPCKQLGPILEKLAHDYAGRFQLAKIDIDANPQTAQAFQVQSIPTVFVLINGQPFQLFQGAHPESQLRPLFDEMLQIAAQQGVTGTVSAEPAAPAPEPELPPLHQEGIAAIERGDLDAAHAAFTKQLAEAPADQEAKLALAQVELMQRTATISDPSAALADAGADVESQLTAADVEFSSGNLDAAFTRLLDIVRATRGDEREKARTRLVEYFNLAGSDPRVAQARQQLAAALF